MAHSREIDLGKVTDEAVINEPFPHFCIDDILDVDFANKIYHAFPSYQDAQKLGNEFAAVNEKRKIQITDYKKFPEPMLQLHKILASKDFIARVEAMTGIPNL